MKKLAVFVSGGGSNMQAIMDGIAEGQIAARICGVVSSSRDAYALERAKNAGIPDRIIRRRDYPTAEEFDRANIAAVEEFGADGIVLAGYMSILGREFVTRYANRIINIHPALIPSFCGEGYYGIKVHEAALAYGVKVTGATTHFVDEGVDAGPIIIQEAVPVLEGDTPKVLQARVLEAEHRIMRRTVALFCADRLKLSGRTVTIV